nr:protein kinase-like domain, phloem protein 2-like protein [Tanacetum cinerariifolium]
MHFPVKVRDVLHQENKEAEFLYFITPEPTNIHDITLVPKQRKDGCMEIQLQKFNSAHEVKDDSFSMNMRFTSLEGTMSGLICKILPGRCFAMKDLGEACQSAYIEKILKRYCMENSKRGSILMQEKLKLSKSQGASTPVELKRMQNVPYALANLGDLHWTTVNKYLRNTKDMFLVYGGRYVFVLNGGAVDWKSAKQSIFATSSVEAEYIAAFDASNEAI